MTTAVPSKAPLSEDALVGAVYHIKGSGFWPSSFVSDNLVETLALLLFVLVARVVGLRVIRGRKEILTKDQRRAMATVRNGLWGVLAIGFIFIWAPQIQTLALSLTAFAVAIIIATKEVIMCLTGGILRASTRPFEIGDWIAIEGTGGEVMDIGAFSVLLQEVDMKSGSYQFTGRTIKIPNSKFFTANIENQKFIKRFIYYDVSIAIQFTEMDPDVLMTALQEITAEETAPYAADSLAFIRRVKRKSALDFPDPTPHYGLRTTDLGHLVFQVRIFIPTREASELSGRITRRFLAHAYSLRQKEVLKS